MESRPKKLLDQVRDAVRIELYARTTEQAYVYWDEVERVNAAEDEQQVGQFRN